MALTNDEHASLMHMTRQEMIQVLCDSSDAITPLPQEHQGEYLFGKLNDNRAVCLFWNDAKEGCVNSHILRCASREIGRVGGLQVPFLFFGPCTLVVQDDLFTFAQLPCYFEGQGDPMLLVMQEMERQGNACISSGHARKDGKG